MLLSSVIIVLREVLEGAILMSVLMALSSMRGMHLRWSLIALVLGIAGACIYAAGFETVAAWFDYVGQEVVNASLHVLIVMFLAVFAILYTAGEDRHAGVIITCMTLAVALTIVREGSEILLYLSGYLGREDALSSVVLGSIIGAGIGVSIGALLYYSLVFLIPVHSMNIGHVLLAFFSAGMLSHAVAMLTQADWLPSLHVLWDSSSLLAEDSLLGQLLYAIIGYEATPTPTQVIAYIGGVLLLLLVPRLFLRGYRRS